MPMRINLKRMNAMNNLLPLCKINENISNLILTRCSSKSNLVLGRKVRFDIFSWILDESTIMDFIKLHSKISL